MLSKLNTVIALHMIKKINLVKIKDTSMCTPSNSSTVFLCKVNIENSEEIPESNTNIRELGIIINCNMCH